MIVSEAEQLFASRLAYVDLDKAYNEIYDYTHKPVTIKDALSYLKYIGTDLGDFEKNCMDPDGNLKEEYSFAEDWVIKAVVNQNTTNEPAPPNGDPVNTGLFACILDTGDANILACRGSEDYKELINYRQDWRDADLKLLNSTMTSQEGALEAFMIKYQSVLERKPWVSTGHSLGGALADYAAIMSVKYGIGHYSGTINFDGPGHSGEFIEKYKDEIAQVCDKMVHKKASIVGHLLNDIPGVKQHTIAVKDVEGFHRHLMKNWDLDGELETKPGEPRCYETALGDLSRYIDWLPAPVGNLLICAANLVIEGIFWGAQFKEDHPVLFKALLIAILTVALSHPMRTTIALKFVAALIAYTFRVILVITIGKLIFEGLEWLLKEVVEGVCAAVSWLKGKAVELYNATIEFIRAVPGYIRSLTPGGKYVSGNPYFRADPDLLRNYARRLAAVNSRIMSLDRDMNDLYWQVGLLDMLDILQANVLSGYSVRIRLAQNYLQSAAERLENADNQALRYMGG